MSTAWDTHIKNDSLTRGFIKNHHTVVIPIETYPPPLPHPETFRIYLPQNFGTQTIWCHHFFHYCHLLHFLSALLPSFYLTKTLLTLHSSQVLLIYENTVELKPGIISNRLLGILRKNFPALLILRWNSCFVLKPLQSSTNLCSFSVHTDDCFCSAFFLSR